MSKKFSRNLPVHSTRKQRFSSITSLFKVLTLKNVPSSYECALVLLILKDALTNKYINKQKCVPSTQMPHHFYKYPVYKKNLIFRKNKVFLIQGIYYLSRIWHNFWILDPQCSSTLYLFGFINILIWASLMSLM